MQYICKILNLLTDTNKFVHITPVLKSLHWLLLEKRIDIKVLPLVYCAVQDEAPDYMRELKFEHCAQQSSTI